jgi:hypothetical protein
MYGAIVGNRLFPRSASAIEEDPVGGGSVIGRAYCTADNSAINTTIRKRDVDHTFCDV